MPVDLATCRGRRDRLRRAHRGQLSRCSRRRGRRGSRGYTHLFNAMPPLAEPRARARSARRSSQADACVSLIADFHHVSAPALRHRDCGEAGAGKAMLITDAMSVTGTDLESFELQGRTIFRRDGRLVTADGTLAGSDLDMATAVRNCHRAARHRSRAARLAWRRWRPASFCGSTVSSAASRPAIARKSRAARRCAERRARPGSTASKRRRPRHA